MDSLSFIIKNFRNANGGKFAETTDVPLEGRHLPRKIAEGEVWPKAPYVIPNKLGQWQWLRVSALYRKHTLENGKTVCYILKLIAEKYRRGLRFHWHRRGWLLWPCDIRTSQKEKPFYEGQPDD